MSQIITPFCFLTAVLLNLLFITPVRAEAPVQPAGLLYLENSGVIPGNFGSSADQGIVPWQAADFLRPFEFPGNRISRVQFPQSKDLAQEVDLKIEDDAQAAHFTFILASGDQINGRILEWTPRRVKVATSEFGEVHLQTSALRRAFRTGNNSRIIFPRLSGLDHWTASKSDWIVEGFSPASSTRNAKLYRKLNIPDKAIIEFELSWNKTADFSLAMAIPGPAPQADDDKGWTLTCWDGKLALVRELPKAADLCAVEGVDFSKRRIHLLAYLDQTAGEMHLFHQQGVLAAHLKLPPENETENKKSKFQPGRGLQLINRSGEIRLDQLSVMEWSGKLPGQSNGEYPQIELADGTVVSGAIQSLPADDGAIAIRIGDAESPYRIEDIASMQFDPPPESAERPMMLAIQNGSRVSGILQHLQSGTLTMISPDIDEPLRLPVSQVLGMTMVNDGANQVHPQGITGQMILRDASQVDRPAAKTPAPVVMTQVPVNRAIGINAIFGGIGVAQVQTATVTPEEEEEDAPGTYRHSGILVDGEGDQHTSCLVWQPLGSRIASPLKKAASGKILYRKPKPATPQVASPQNRVRPGQNFGTLFLKKVGEPALPKSNSSLQTMHLRTGDVIPCRVLAIDEEGVLISSSIVEEQKVPHVKIKAIELAPHVGLPSLEDVKKERLLTLPRMQKASPPTHLLCSLNSDFLRCRVLKMHDDVLTVELQLDEIDLPVNRLSRMIWLHPEDLKTDAPESADSGSAQANTNTDINSTLPDAAVTETSPQTATPQVAEPPVSTDKPAAEATSTQSDTQLAGMVQALTTDGKRTTFTAQRFQSGVLSGQSDILGQCHVELVRLNELTFGAEIGNNMEELPYEQWKLTPSIEPLVAQDLGDDDGKSSLLVGQPAPDFDLELLEGGRFKVSDQKGRIIVLDFWATWCGPCMQTIPLLHDLMAEYDPQQVRLISVNLEEPAAHVKSVMERHQFDLTVALDQDGVAAHRYEATAIPQLVVINTQGTVTQVFVGGGPHMIEQLKAALNDQLKQQ